MSRSKQATAQEERVSDKPKWTGEDRCDHCGALCGHANKCYECGQPKRKES